MRPMEAPLGFFDNVACLFCYFFFLTPFYLGVFLAGSILATVLPPWNLDVYRDRIRSFGIFMVCVLFAGAITNTLWSVFVWGHYYESVDYFLDFLPFMPISQGIIDETLDQEWHGLIGVTMFQLQVIWFLFAALTWCLAIYFHRTLLRWLNTRDKPSPMIAIPTEA